MAGGVAGSYDSETMFGTVLDIDASDTNKIPLQGNKTVKAWTVLSVLAYRKELINDKDLYWTVVRSDGTPMVHAGLRNINGFSSIDVGSDNYVLMQFEIRMTFSGSNLFNADIVRNNHITMPRSFYGAGAEYSLDPWISPGKNYYTTFHEVNTDRLPEGVPADGSYSLSKQRSSNLYIRFQLQDRGALGSLDDANWISSNTLSSFNFEYPPYIQIVPDPPFDKDTDFSNNGSENSDGIDIGGISATSLIINRKYSITRAKYGSFPATKQSVSWSPNGTTGPYNFRITNKCIVDNVGTGNSSPYEFYTPNIIGGSYKAYVQRYYTDKPHIQARSRSITLYTYSLPTLSSLSVSPTSQRANAEIKLSYIRNNRTFQNIENNYKTVIWSNYKSSYINEHSTADNRTLTSPDLKTLFPDMKANNKGITTGTVYIRRDNIGVSGGNPSSGIVYSSATLSSSISVYYTPQYPVDKNSLTKRKTNSGGHLYELTDTVHDDYTFENLYFGWTHDTTSNTAGEVDGYRIVFIDSDGQRYAADVAGGRNISGNDGYFKDASKGYTVNMDNIRHMTNQKIEITPYYNASNGTKWYGPSQTWDIGIVVKRLNKPLISYPTRNSNWINKKFRVLFQLPEDPDYGRTSYTGDSQYHYNNIELCINDVWYLKIRNYNYNNAQNANWGIPQSITNINAFSSNVNDSNDNNTLIYKKKILMEPDIESTFPTGYNQYKLKIRIQKKYGLTGKEPLWSEWSDVTPVTITPRTYNVNVGDYIMASHYNDMTAMAERCYNTYKLWDNWKRNQDAIPGAFGTRTGTIIGTTNRDQFPNPFLIPKGIKSHVNNYAPIVSGREYLKFDNNSNSMNVIPETYDWKEELVTAKRDPRPSPNGRNYFGLLTDWLNALV